MTPDVQAIVQQLSIYLRKHPDACDTSEGIAHWWITGVSSSSVPVAVVETALRWMRACGVVEAIHAADGRIRYRRADVAPGATPYGTADIDARLDALASNPQAVLPVPGGTKRQPPRMH
ncbi:MAG: hypothetical protein IPG93_04730 [Burkholderiales bacterium]|nr:hypothetical protein [Burkholderiales bacterium]